jgi:sigma-B regulation protein RsbU (phosphoserine phosphatase)
MAVKQADSKAKILIVDDNANNLSVLGQLLRNLDYECEFALSGIEALNWIKKDVFDLILLDVVMPNMNGYEVCAKIKSEKKYSHIPIIFITIKDDIKSTIKGFENGAVDYINKPFNSDELSVRISTQIELKKSRDKLSQTIKELEGKNKYIMESINYAQYIQKHILPNIEDLNKYFDNQFIIYRPKQVVSGDFYWFKTIGNLAIFSVVDCTGHGVPGALMSMVAYTILNQAVNEKSLYQPVQIIKYAHDYLLNLFHKKNDGNFEDGMDITVCSINTETNILKIAGAGQKAIFFGNNELKVIVGDPLSVGEVGGKNDNFNDTELTFKKGDSVYLQSDGIIYQFAENGGPKFGTKRYLALLKKINNKSMTEQSVLLSNEYDNWIGTGAQIDDITIWGIKF